jgi:hypothetical protein
MRPPDSDEPYTYLSLFEERFGNWVRHGCAERRREVPSVDFYHAVRQRLGDEVLNWVGWGLQTRLITDEDHHFRVRGAEARRYKWLSLRDSMGYPLDPNWEEIIHLAYFVRLWHPCQEAGMRLGFEDRGMDITASRADELVWYVEVKRNQELADRLVRDLTRLSSEPVPIRAIDRNDPLRDAKAKVKYLAEYRPSYFSAVAPGTERHFEIDYLRGVGFRLRDSASPVHLLAHQPDNPD